ncbi:MAG: TerB family tellurite resistance protein [Alphaproteobacteria bacterium]
MIDRIKALFGAQGNAADGAGPHKTDELHLAAAALLVEAAAADGEFDAGERARIEVLLRARFGLAREETAELVEMAAAEVSEANQLYAFTRAVKDRFSHEERIEMMEMLWEVAYADGELHDFEAHLLRRIGGLIYVSDRERGEARRRALARLGIEADTASA